MKTKETDEQEKKAVPVETFVEYAVHQSWRCFYYERCHCGLDAITDKLGLDRISLEVYIS